MRVRMVTEEIREITKKTAVEMLTEVTKVTKTNFLRILRTNLLRIPFLRTRRQLTLSRI